MKTGIYTKVYNSNRIAATCECGHELITMLNSRRFGHVLTRGVDCVPKPLSAWIVTLDGIRPAAGETKADHMTFEELTAAADQSFNGKCDGCGHKLATELDLASHFVITDRRHLNLGECPVQIAMKSNPWAVKS